MTPFTGVPLTVATSRKVAELIVFGVIASLKVALIDELAAITGYGGDVTVTGEVAMTVGKGMGAGAVKKLHWVKGMAWPARFCAAVVIVA